ncbi:MAG: hypothetical protein M1837_005485 [Sclerophora amabilis]|nr:MAG: hypothetical protein M1837_005485 [Sclerophora amabilis]
MLIDGEKYACDACVRGHRVSNCQHSDRPLQHINKKGRPVSQCHHCRGLRKSRSAHVKCDCGEKGHSQGQCAHLEKGDSKDHGLCCCSHGGKCSCSLKKEHHLDPVPELDATDEELEIMGSGRPKPPQLTTANSDTSLTVFANGHHKPIHKNNHMAHKCGAPYKIPRPHTIHGRSEAQRSVDSLPVTNTLATTDDGTRQIKDSFASAQRDVRLVRSEHGSPHPSSPSNLDRLNEHLPPLDISSSGFPNSTAPATAPSRPHLDLNSITSAPYVEGGYFVSTPEADVAAFSAGLDAPPVDWSQFELPVGTNNVSSPYSQPPSYASFDYNNLSQPAHTNASSGDVSELDEFSGPFGDPSPLRPPSLVNNAVASDSSEIWDSDSYRLSSASSFHGLPQTSILSSNNLDCVDIDDFIKGAAVGTSFSGHESMSDAHPSPFANGFPIEASQKLAPTSVPPNDDMRFSRHMTSASPDPVWIPQLNNMGSRPASANGMTGSVWT